MPFCTDEDLLYFEPTLLKECRSLAVQVMAGTAAIVGTTLTAAGVHFVGSPVRVGMLLAINNGPMGVIRAITSDTALRVSVPHAWVPEADGVEAGIGDGSGVAFAIYSFPQLRPPAEEMRELLELNNATFDAEPLRRVNALGTLAAIFRSMAALDHTIYAPTTGSFDTYLATSGYQQHAEGYEERFRHAMKNARVRIDLEGDGLMDETRSNGSSRVVRE